MPARADLVATLSLAWRKALTEAGGPLLDEDVRVSADLLALACADAQDPSHAEEAAERASLLLMETRLPAPAAARATVAALTSIDGLAPLLGTLLSRYTAATQRQLLEHQDALHHAVNGARDLAERALRASEVRFRALFTEAAVGIAIGDLHGHVVDANPALQGILGYDLEELCATTGGVFSHPDDPPELARDYLALVAGKADSFHTRKRYRHRDGHAIWTNLTIFLIRTEDGEPAFEVALIEDVTASHELQDRMLHQATHDALTGLPNRALFLQRLEEAIVHPRPDSRVALCFLDLDGFKFLNDSRGHLVGDQVLQAVARRLAGAVEGRGSLLARLAGDEFVVLITGTPEDIQTLVLAKQLQAALDAPIDVEGQVPVTVRTSIGVVEVRAGEAVATDLLRAAELALHAAKEDGRGTIVAHDPSRTARQLTRFEIAMSLPGVVDRGELTLRYQPLVRLAGGGLHGVEALLRWRHPRLGDLSPELFVSIAEESSAIVPIGRWVLETACRDLAESPEWPAVNINVSIRQLYSPTFIQDVRAALATSGLAPHRLRIEVTERVLMGTDDQLPLTTLRTLADLGVRIVLDDFGTGYSNLAALRRFPLHELKLAGTFVAATSAAGSDEVDVKLLATLVGLAHTLDLSVTAEGVETSGQAELVRTIGCDVGQGWYYGADVPCCGSLAQPAPEAPTVH
jgi:diguanylate cyclase (GGDEF)-like protein/PAS domain S-box-containing protein